MVIQPHRIVKQCEQTHHFHVRVLFSTVEQLGILPHPEPVVETVDPALQDIQGVGLMQHVGDALGNDHSYSRRLTVDHDCKYAMSRSCLRSRACSMVMAMSSSGRKVSSSLNQGKTSCSEPSSMMAMASLSP